MKEDRFIGSILIKKFFKYIGWFFNDKYKKKRYLTLCTVSLDVLVLHKLTILKTESKKLNIG